MINCLHLTISNNLDSQKCNPTVEEGPVSIHTHLQHSYHANSSPYQGMRRKFEALTKGLHGKTKVLTKGLQGKIKLKLNQTLTVNTTIAMLYVEYKLATEIINYSNNYVTCKRKNVFSELAPPTQN